MNPSRISALALALALPLVAPPPAVADTEDAFCEVHRHGEAAANATGFCTVSQRQGHLTIELANGERFELAPGKQAGRFQDQDGNGVDHDVRKDGSHQYKWEHGDIVIRFDRDEGKYH